MAELQGVWRLIEQTLRGGKVHTQQTHLVVHGDSWREIWNRVLYTDEPRPSTTYRTEGDLLHMATHWHQPEGTVQGPFTATWRYLRDGNQLKVCNAGNDLVPDQVDDHEGVVAHYELETDHEVAIRVSTPQTYVDKPTRHHPTLGELRWDSNLDWLKSVDGLVSLAVPQDANLEAYAKRVEQIKGSVGAYKLYTANELLELHNGSWREEPGKETQAGFIGKLVLDGITVYEDLSAEVYFQDGGLFWGHIVLLSVDTDGKPTSADIAG
ncbi:MAG: DUF2262 domain-containing protein [Proteobacteria bacterium]|nr:DUF2262 domain-containing protein [Pseudomonadota bacterium]